MNDVFKRASKQQLRFETGKNGLLSVEDLWQLSLEDLDKLARAINKKIKDEGEESFIGKPSKSNAELNLKLDILKEIIKTRLEEEETSKTRAEKREKLNNLKTLLAEKEIDEIKGKTKEEILREIELLDEA